MKKLIFFSIVINWVCLLLIGLNNCTKTTFGHLNYTLGWNGDHTYVLKVRGVWDRNNFYLDGKKKKISDLGKVATSAFELKKQAEIFARTRAIFSFQEEIEEYFNSIYVDENEKNSLEKEEEEEVENNERIYKVNEDNNNEDNTEVDNSLITIKDPSITLTSENETPKVYYENPNQYQGNDLPPTPDSLPPTVDELIAPDLPNSYQTNSSTPSPQLRKLIDFPKIYEKINLKITLLEKIYTDENDVDIIYIFTGKNLKKELVNAFDISSGVIELQK